MTTFETLIIVGGGFLAYKVYSNSQAAQQPVVPIDTTGTTDGTGDLIPPTVSGISGLLNWLEGGNGSVPGSTHTTTGSGTSGLGSTGSTTPTGVSTGTDPNAGEGTDPNEGDLNLPPSDSSDDGSTDYGGGFTDE